MRRLQLFGRGRDEGYTSIDSNLQKPKIRSFHDKKALDDNSQLLSLPSKVLDQILELLDIPTLLSLCLVNSRFYDIISNKFLYQNVVLKDKLALLKFAALIHCESHTTEALTKSRAGVSSQNLRFLVRSVEFMNPIYQDSILKYGKYCGKDQVSTIGGSYRLATDDVRQGMQSMAREKSPELSSRSPSMERGRSLDNKHLRGTQISSSLGRQTQSPLRAFFDISSTSRSKMMAKYESHTYIELMLDIIDFCPNLTHIILSDIQQGFKIPLWYSILNDKSRDFYNRIIKGQQSLNRADMMSFELSAEWLSSYAEKYHSLPRFKKLELRAAKDKLPVRLRSNMLSCFGIFEELILQNMAIDAESLDTPLEYMPLYMKVSEGGFLDLHLPVTSLSLDTCEIVPGNGLMKLMCSYFNRVKTLKLLNIGSKYDLILTNCFPSLRHLIIDCNSKCFNNERIVNSAYYHDETPQDYPDDVSVGDTLVDSPTVQELVVPPATAPIILAMNGGYIKRANDSNGKKPGMILDAQEQYFKTMRIPPFHYFFHYFKSLWDRLPTKNIKISIVNIPFTNVYPLQPDIFWRQIELYTDDDLQTLCGIPHAEELDENEHYWDPAVSQCFKDVMLDTDAEPNYSDHQLWNSYQNSRIFRDIPNVNLWLFLKSLSKFKSVEIQMLRKWLLCTPRSRYDWEILLKPILNGRIPVTVRDNDGFILYKYGSG
ncbi:LANO_0E04962g1_1 [Lachancea nothofagi CBS 11611]|uniref:LANO_0E04962g1_1 n=1 Tax=Lachancea nothofagi CBS 11611 TaxID=1266666 RepID=A0A1G4JT00_9SACH|nr:LANO_0E04962g1_1 [Lachancea nothofagi CBS 11611]